jgi:hypothetical protein
LKGGVAGIVVGAAIDGLLDGVGWIQGEGGQIQKPGTSVSVPTHPENGDVYFYSQYGGTRYSTVSEACASHPSGYGVYPIVGIGLNGSTWFCTVAIPQSDGTTRNVDISVSQGGGGCPSGTTLSSSGACVGTPTFAPITDSDLGVLDGFIKGKDGVWQRDLTTELCGENEGCYKGLAPDTSLTGPSKVTGTPQTVTTTSPTGSVSTSVKTPTSTITYGPNYYDYSTTTTTTTNNGGDSTTVNDDTDTSFPVPPDIFGGANDGLGGVRDSIPGTSATTSPIPYMAWWSFSQSCSEITFAIPVYGNVTTALCPVYKQYIWPVLYFFFAVFTWFSCFEIWRKTAMRVRAS